MRAQVKPPHLLPNPQLSASVLSLALPTSILSSPAWFAFGAVSSYTLYSYDDWLGYVGGIGLAIFLASIILQTFSLSAGTRHIGRTYFSAFFVTVLLYLANVWTVAYAFVPGGEYLRERSDL